MITGNEQRNNAILNLWAAGHSSGSIAVGLGITRNVVMGAIFRAQRRGDPRSTSRETSSALPTRSEKQESRNAAIDALVAAGATRAAVARQFGISQARVSQIWRNSSHEVA